MAKKLTISFLLPEEQETAEMAFYATKLHSVIYEMDKWLHKMKNETDNEGTFELYNNVHKELWEIIEDEKIKHLFG